MSLSPRAGPRDRLRHHHLHPRRDLESVGAGFGRSSGSSMSARRTSGIARSEYSGTTSRAPVPRRAALRADDLLRPIRPARRRGKGHAATDCRTAVRSASSALARAPSAAYERPVDSMTFFEIDQAVIDLARDTRALQLPGRRPEPAGGRARRRAAVARGRTGSGVRPARARRVLHPTPSRRTC